MKHLTKTNTYISSINSASILINLCSLGFIISCFLEKNDMDLFTKLKYNSLESILLSNSNMFFLPRPKSAASCVSKSKVKILNLLPYISNITCIMSNALEYWPFPT